MIEAPLVSVIILNYNGAKWMLRCLESLKSQTLFARIELIIADNASSDGSDALSEKLIAGWSNACFVQNGANIGFAAGCNRAVERTTGKYFFFLNPDVWLEPDCLQQLVERTEKSGAGAAGALVLDYDDNSFQSFGGDGFDIFGLGVGTTVERAGNRLFTPVGFYFIRADLFRKLGGYDEKFFLYAEDTDLSWRVWLSGHRIVAAPLARIHHRGGASVNPAGGTKIIEVRTSESKRYYANKNNLVTLLKNCRHILLLLALANVFLLAVEAFLGLLVARRFSFVRVTFLNVLRDCWTLRHHICAERKKIAGWRRHGDFWMLRFLTWRLSHWDDLARVFKLGLPRVDK
jgi:GT2 family glycosyltransferase